MSRLDRTLVKRGSIRVLDRQKEAKELERYPGALAWFDDKSFAPERKIVVGEIELSRVMPYIPRDVLRDRILRLAEPLDIFLSEGGCPEVNLGLGYSDIPLTTDPLFWDMFVRSNLAGTAIHHMTHVMTNMLIRYEEHLTGRQRIGLRGDYFTQIPDEDGAVRFAYFWLGDPGPYTDDLGKKMVTAVGMAIAVLEDWPIAKKIMPEHWYALCYDIESIDLDKSPYFEVRTEPFMSQRARINHKVAALRRAMLPG